MIQGIDNDKARIKAKKRKQPTEEDSDSKDSSTLQDLRKRLSNPPLSLKDQIIPVLKEEQAE